MQMTLVHQSFFCQTSYSPYLPNLLLPKFLLYSIIEAGGLVGATPQKYKMSVCYRTPEATYSLFARVLNGQNLTYLMNF